MKVSVIKKVGTKNVVTLIDTFEEPNYKDYCYDLDGNPLKEMPKAEEPKKILTRGGTVEMSDAWKTGEEAIKKVEVKEIKKKTPKKMAEVEPVVEAPKKKKSVKKSVKKSK